MIQFHLPFHINFSYDHHLIIAALAKKYGASNIDLVGTSKEKYSKISTRNFVFVDSYSHLSDSLDNLAKNLHDKGEDLFTFVRDEFPDDNQFNLCLKKLVYPYSYMDSFEKFSEPIPGPECFYNELTETDIEADEYSRLEEACVVFNITNLGELHDLYLKIDVLILASVFEYYRIMGLEEYGLDPAYYISAPSFGFDSMLFMTGVKLELLQDEEMYKFFEKGRRGKNT